METALVVVVVAGVVVWVVLLLYDPPGPAVAGPCGLVTRPILRDYCSGTCAAGQACVPTATRSYLLFGTQAAACACGTIVSGGTGAGVGTTGSGGTITEQPSETPTGSTTGGTSSGIAPVTGSTYTGPTTSGVSPDERCMCTQAEEDAELAQMIALYTAAVDNARDPAGGGYQAGNDPGYSDPGFGLHRVGNCADWQTVSWGALCTRTWRCWRIHKIRARQDWTVFGFHHFVKLEAVCSGKVIFLDPWKTGTPFQAPPSSFEFADGNGWSHTTTHTHRAGDPPRQPHDD